MLIGLAAAQANYYGDVAWRNMADHDGGTSTDPYWSYFPNGDNNHIGYFKLGHRHKRMHPTFWPFTSWSTYIYQSPIADDMIVWKTTNGYTSIMANIATLWPWLCPRDSDGDGYSNGVEMGDPNCLYPGTAPGPVLSDPNDKYSTPAPINFPPGPQWCHMCGFHVNGRSDVTYTELIPNANARSWGGYWLGHRMWTGPLPYSAYTPADALYDPVTYFSTAMGGGGTDIFWAIDTYHNNAFTANDFPLGYNSVDDRYRRLRNLPGLWAAICPLDSDGDGYTNGQELGDPSCLFPGVPATDCDLSDPNSAASVPLGITCPTTTTTTTTTTTAPPPPTTTTTMPNTTTTGPPTTTRTTTLRPTTLSLAPTSWITAMPPLVTNISNITNTTVDKCPIWYEFEFDWGPNITTFTTKACVTGSVGDPHYELHNGRFITCDSEGMHVLIESEEAMVIVKHETIGTDMSVISQAQYIWKNSSRSILFDKKPNVLELSDSEVFVNPNGAVDIWGKNYIEVQRVATPLGTFLNVIAVFENPIGGIYIEGCDKNRSVPYIESDVCREIVDDFARYSCNADIKLTQSTDFVEMAIGVQTARAQLKPIPKPADPSPRTRAKPVNESSGTSLGVIIVIVCVAVVAIGAGGGLLFIYMRRKPNLAIQSIPATVDAKRFYMPDPIPGESPVPASMTPPQSSTPPQSLTPSTSSAHDDIALTDI